MAATKTSNCDEHFSVEKLKEWPEPESVSLMEVLAREDIDEAVHAILFRENYIVKRMDTYFQHQAFFKERRKEMLHRKWVENVAQPLQQRIIEKVISYRPGKSQGKHEYCLKHPNKPTNASPLCECLFRRQQELREAKGTSYQHGTGKQNDTQKEPKGTGKAPLFSRSPQFMLTSHAIVLKERQRASARPGLSKPRGTCSSEKLVCASKPHLSQEEETLNLSQLAFERQFRFWKLSQENKEAEKKGPVLGTQPPRPRSWAAADSRHSQGPPAVGRRVMTAELLGKHLASLKGAARSGLQWS